ncbi:MAG: site-2 protease family protein [Candidatus Paceibacterota bacterium]|jgi:regulator of sigma E protease
MNIILFIIVLTVLVFVHELGHFLAAKRAGIRVDEFGIGFPPALFKKKVGETVYSINAFPVGGFVKIFGEDPNDESLKGHDAKRSLTHKPKLIQAWVLVAGITFNILFAWLLVSLGFMIGLPFPADDDRYGSRVQNAQIILTQVLPESPASMAGLKAGDNIVGISSGSEALKDPTVVSVQKFIASHKEVLVSYVRNKEFKAAPITTKEGIVEGRRAVGISMDFAGMLQLPVHEALYAGALTTASLTWGTIVGLADFFTNIFIGHANFADVAGPVGIAGVVGEASALGFVNLLTLVAIISINLAVINLLPFPALDGGRLFFLLIEKIKGSPIKPVVANTANGIGFILLILLMVVVTYHDIAKLIHG